MNIQNTYTIFTAAVVAALVTWSGAGWLVFAIGDKQDQLQTLTQEREAVMTRAAYAQSLRSLARETEQSRAQLAEIAAAPDLVAMIRTAEESATAAGAEMSIETVQPYTFQGESEALPAARIMLSASGTFASVYRLSQLIEASPYLTYIEQATFEREEDGLWAADIHFVYISESIEE